MPALRGLTVSVGRLYADLLAVTLVRNMRHFTSCLVVTAPGDPSIEVARSVPGADVFETTAFYESKAIFNKGYALELSFSHMGRHGWIFIHDADILLPDVLPLERLRPDCLHGMRRRVLDDPSRWRPGLAWSTFPASPDSQPIGYAQLFHAEAPVLRGRRPWYDVSFGHAGGGDAYFVGHFPAGQREILPAECLHLGPTDSHWFGTDPKGKDMMARFVAENGWLRAMRKHSPEAAARAEEPVHRVEVPGYEPSGYELPFVRRAQQQGR